MKTVFIVAGSMLLVACTNGKPITEPFVSTDCGPVGGYTQTMVTYGDNGIEMKELSLVRVNTEWRTGPTNSYQSRATRQVRMRTQIG
jgi:hypothetical protein